MKRLLIKLDIIGTIIFVSGFVNFVLSIYHFKLFDYGMRESFSWHLYILPAISFLLVLRYFWVKFAALLFSVLTFYSFYGSLSNGIFIVQTLYRMETNFLEITPFILFLLIIIYSFYSITLGYFLECRKKAVLK